MRILFINGREEYKSLSYPKIEGIYLEYVKINYISFINNNIFILDRNLKEYSAVVICRNEHGSHRLNNLITYINVNNLNPKNKRIELILFDIPSYNFNKITINHIFSELGYPMVPSIFTYNEKKLLEFCNHHGYPVVGKPIEGSGGMGVRLLHSNEEVIKDLHSKKGERSRRLYQKFIPNDLDLRYLYAFDEFQLAITKIDRDPDEFRNNVNCGAKRGYYDAKEDELELCQRLYKDYHKLTGGCILGIDLVRDKNTGELYIFELNSTPEFLITSLWLKIDVTSFLIGSIINNIIYNEDKIK